MGKKSQDTTLGFAILCGFALYPFVLLYETLGAIGFTLLMLFVVGGVVVWLMRAIKQDSQQATQKTAKLSKINYVVTNKEDAAQFNRQALYTLRKRLHPDEARAMCRQYERTYFGRSYVLRCLQILRDSIDIALASKNIDVAKSRRKSVIENFNCITANEYGQVITKETFNEIRTVVEQFLVDYPTQLCMNIAKGHVKKALSLKTEKSKTKYLQLAIDTLNEGLASGECESAVLYRELLDIRLLLPA